MAERVVIRELIVKLLFEGNESGVTKFNQALQGFSTLARYAEQALRKLSDAVIGTTLQIADQADALGESAAQVGVTAQVYDALTAAVLKNGGSVGELDGGLRILSGHLREFRASGTGALKDLLGPDAKKSLEGITSVDGALGVVADALARIKNPAEQVAAANDLLGRSGNKLLPTLQGGAKGIRDMLESMVAMGTFSPELLQAGSDLNDQLAEGALLWRGVKIAVGEETVPALHDLVTELNLAFRSAKETFGPEIRDAARMLASGFRAAKDALKSLRTELLESARGMAALKTVAIFLGFALSGLALAQLPGAIRALWAMRFALERVIQSTIVWIVGTALAVAPYVIAAAMLTVIALIVEDLVGFVTGANSAFGLMVDKMHEMGPIWDAIANSLEYVFGGGIGNDLYDMIEAVSGAVDRLREKLGPVVDMVGKAANLALMMVPGGAGIAAGARALGSMVPSASSVGARTSNVSVGGSSVNVAVNGAGNPRAVGAEVARQADEVMARHATQVARNLGSAMSY